MDGCGGTGATLVAEKDLHDDNKWQTTYLRSQVFTGNPAHHDKFLSHRAQIWKVVNMPDQLEEFTSEKKRTTVVRRTAEISSVFRTLQVQVQGDAKMLRTEKHTSERAVGKRNARKSL